MIPKVIFTLVNLICITVCANIAVDGFYNTLSSRLVQKPAVARQNVYQERDTQRATRPLSAYKAVLDRNLFDTRSKVSTRPTEKVDVESLEETTLNLKLWGTVFGDEDTDYAVIEDVKARQQNLYRTGDSVQTATVKKIYREKVVLTVNGKDEILQMQELETGKGGARSSGPPARSSSPSSEAVRAQRISLRRSYIDEAMEDMANLMTQIQIRPHMENGAAAGLALSSIKPNSIFRRMGLRNGDVIVGVDGNEIATVNDALGLVDSLQSASKVSVQLKRRGREKNIEYSIR